MTPEPMSDEKWQEIDHTATMYGNDALSEEDFNAVLAEISRLKAAQAIPPDVLAAMERYRQHKMACSDERRAESPYWLEHGGIWHMERLKQDAFDIASHFTSHHGKDGA